MGGARFRGAIGTVRVQGTFSGSTKTRGNTIGRRDPGARHAGPGRVEGQGDTAILPHLNAAMARGEITTLRRAQYFLAHVGHESASLRYFEEIASGAAYEGRTDLGNIHPGDGSRFKGRGPIQLTGRRNYANFGDWLGQGDLLVDKPALVARCDYALLAAVFYWSTRQLNAYCDRGDFLGMVHTPGGGHMGTDDRLERLRAVERLGDAVLPMGKGSYSDRGRDRRCWRPPAQIPACTATWRAAPASDHTSPPR